MLQLGGELADSITKGENIGNDIEKNAYKVMSPAAQSPTPSSPKSVANSDFNPYVTIELHLGGGGGGEKQRTNWIEHSNGSPEWNEILTFDMNPKRTKKQRKSVLIINGKSKRNLLTEQSSNISSNILLKFEAWHRDLGVSLDDHVGSGALSIDVKRFTNEDSWKMKEIIRLQNHRGVSSGW
jgi:hypothetical protein